MKIENIDIQATIEKAQALVRDDEQLSAATKSMFEILILVITLLANRLNLNSTNSSKPPSSDPNRKKQARKRAETRLAAKTVMWAPPLKRSIIRTGFRKSRSIAANCLRDNTGRWALNPARCSTSISQGW
jgi:hypothetical protein